MLLPALALSLLLSAQGPMVSVRAGGGDISAAQLEATQRQADAALPNRACRAARRSLSILPTSGPMGAIGRPACSADSSAPGTSSGQVGEAASAPSAFSTSVASCGTMLHATVAQSWTRLSAVRVATAARSRSFASAAHGAPCCT